MAELSDLRGIGPASAAVLAEHGLGTVSKLARAGVDALTAVPGFGATRARAVLDAARDALGADPVPAATVSAPAP
ncbi:MAG TPA: helix-hairpin-helix domain-containing protein, partial [Acidimicrobiales bacterium]|nr:helix-hairpin-helix domain-containing protein [Acidimicrobiales bacterium]